MQDYQAVKIVDRIAAAVLNNVDGLKETGLMVGRGGLILFLFYYARFKDKEEYYKAAADKLEGLIAVMNENYELRNGYATGITGIIWLLNHLYVHGFVDLDMGRGFGAVDKLIEESMIYSLKNNQLDFMYGGLGEIMAFIDRKGGHFKTVLESAVELLDKSKKVLSQDTLCWPIIAVNAPKTGMNIGMAHGIASVIAVLSIVGKNGVCTKNLGHLLHNGANYLLGQQIDFKTYGSCFSSYSVENKENAHKSRLAWCYGDLGTAVSILQAARVLENRIMEEKALEILLKSAGRRDLAENGVSGPFICHGAGGIGLIFNRLARSTGRKEFAEAAGFWVSRMLDLISTDRKGLLFRNESSEERINENNIGFLDGAAGIGLVLIAYITGVGQEWDRALLLD